MKKTLLLLAAMAAVGGVMAAEWEKPVYTGGFAALTPGDTVYIYNVGAKKFLTEGNDWGTHATVGDTGLQFTVEQSASENWDGTTYVIKNNSVHEGGWKNMFITDNGNVYMDRREQADYFFSFVDKGSNVYNIIGASANPVWNAEGDNEGYMMAHFTGYFNSKDGVETGTGVIYDYLGFDNNYQDGEINADWAFVSQSDYAVYASAINAYLAAGDYKALIDEAQAMGVDVTEELTKYGNTSATVEDINAAIGELNAKILAFYETSVTPDNPKNLSDMIANPTCDAIDGWNNNIGATTWNTQSWIDDSWQGMEGTTLNIWGASMNGTVSQKLTGIPNGIYVMSLAVYSEKLDGYVFANENTKSVVGASAGKAYEITTEVTDGELTFGFGQDATGTNWVAIDNASVKYFGSGVEAYRYWLNGLLESAPSFDEVIVQNALVDEYEGVLASVNTATTKDEILGVIPAYEEVLNRINVNIEAYKNLNDQITEANNLVNSENINALYGDALGDMANEMQDTWYAHELGTEEINDTIAKLKALCDVAQQYIWNMESLQNEMASAEDIYSEYSSTCSLEAALAYEDFVADYHDIDIDTLTVDAAKVLLEQLYAIEFNLKVPTDPATDDNPVDYSAKISYPSYDAGNTGWTNNGWGTCDNNTGWYGFATVDGALADDHYLNLWTASGTPSVSQTITGLPNGTYVVKIGAYADNAGFEVFANEDVQPVSVGQTETYERGQWYEIVTEVSDGTLTIGARSTVEGESWAMIDNWSLFYCGTESEKTPTAIDSAKPSVKSAVAIYSVNGIQRAVLQKGINVVKGADGSVRKVLVK